MSAGQVGEARRLLDFGEPGGELRALGLLLEALRSSALCGGGALSERRWDEAPETVLLDDLLRSPRPQRTELGLCVLRQAVREGVCPAGLALARLAALLPSANPRAAVAALGELWRDASVVDGPRDPAAHPLLHALSLSPDLWEPVLRWALTQPLEEVRGLVLALYLRGSSDLARSEVRRRCQAASQEWAGLFERLAEWECRGEGGGRRSLAGLSSRLLSGELGGLGEALAEAEARSESAERWELALLVPGVLHLYSSAGAIQAIGGVDEAAHLTRPSKAITARYAKQPKAPPTSDGSSLPFESTDEVVEASARHFLTLDSDKQMELLQAWTSVAEGQTLSPTSLSLFSAALLELEDECCLRALLDLISKVVGSSPQLSPHLLALFLHRYSLEKLASTKELLHRALPSLASHHLVAGSVSKICLALAKSPLGIEVCAELWRRHNSLLGAFLPQLSKAPEEAASELGLAKVRFLEAVCEEAGAEQGEEVLGLLSKVLGGPNVPADVLAAVLSAIRWLCWAEVMELEAAWGLVWAAVRRRKDSEALLHALCPLLGLASDEETPEAFQSAALKRLWDWSATEDPILVSAALTALALFPADLHELRLMPEKAKLGLKAPSSLISTPLDEAKPLEELLDYVPGPAFLNLLPSAASARPAFASLLGALVKAEVEELGRGVRSLAPVQRVAAAKHLRRLDGLLPKLHSALMGAEVRESASVVGVALLVWYEPPLERKRDGSLSGRAHFQRGRAYMGLLARLLPLVAPEAADWRGSLEALKGWDAFVGRAFDAILEGRRSELAASKTKGADQERRLSSAWLWAREQMMEVLKTSLRESGAALPSALAAMGALARHLLEVEEAEGTTEEQSQFMSPREWQVMVTETLACYAFPAYNAKGGTAFPASLGRRDDRSAGFAALGLSRLLPKTQPLVGDFLGPMEDKLFALVHKSLHGSDSSALHSFYLPLAIQGLVQGKPHARLQMLWKELRPALEKKPAMGRILGAAELALVASDDLAAEVAQLLGRLAAAEDEASLLFEPLWSSLLQLRGKVPLRSADFPDAPLFFRLALAEDEAGAGELLKEISDKERPPHKKREAWTQLGLFHAHVSASPAAKTAAVELICAQAEAALRQRNVLSLSQALGALGSFGAGEGDGGEASQLPADLAYLQEKSVCRALVAALKDAQSSPHLTAAALTALSVAQSQLPPLNWAPLLISHLTAHQLSVARIAVREEVSSLLDSLLSLEPEKLEQATKDHLAASFPGMAPGKSLAKWAERSLGKLLGVLEPTASAQMLTKLLQTEVEEELSGVLLAEAAKSGGELLCAWRLEGVEDLWRQEESSAMEALFLGLPEAERSRLTEAWSLSAPAKQWWAFVVRSEAGRLPAAAVAVEGLAWQAAAQRDVFLALLLHWLLRRRPRPAPALFADWALQVAAQSSALRAEGLERDEIFGACLELMETAALGLEGAQGGVPVDPRTELRRRGPLALAEALAKEAVGTARAKLIAWLAAAHKDPRAKDLLRLLSRAGVLSVASEELHAVLLADIV